MTDVIQARCEHCKELRQYRPSGAHLTLYSHGLMILRFFCLDCRELNAQRVADVKTAETMTNVGVKTEVVRVPLEVAERAQIEDRPTITVTECDIFESANLFYFNERWRRESNRVGG